MIAIKRLIYFSIALILLCSTTVLGKPQSDSQTGSSNREQMIKDIEETGKTAVYGIYFDFDKAVVKPESDSVLEDIAWILKEEDTDLKLYVVGHTDMIGDLEYNMKLSQARANAVVSVLIHRYGIPSSRLKAYGVGPLAPVDTNDTAEGRAKNRRVELVRR